MNYRNTNRGQIWPNDRKEKETQPDFKGSLNIEGEEYLVSAWKQKEGTNPKAQSLSFSVRPKAKFVIEQAKDYVVNTENNSGI